MKNLKKLSRQNLKKVKGAGGPYYPDDSIYNCQCNDSDFYVAEKRACMNIHGYYYSPTCS